MNIIDMAKGSLLGGALGDALGFSVEPLEYDEILQEYGQNGIQEPQLSDWGVSKGKAIISDDTQMTLYTADALLKEPSDDEAVKTVYEHYRDWVYTQVKALMPKMAFVNPNVSSLLELKELREVREPGMTCVYSLYGFGAVPSGTRKKLGLSQ